MRAFTSGLVTTGAGAALADLCGGFALLVRSASSCVSSCLRVSVCQETVFFMVDVLVPIVQPSPPNASSVNAVLSTYVLLLS